MINKSLYKNKGKIEDKIKWRALFLIKSRDRDH